MSTTMYASKKDDGQQSRNNIIPFSFPPLRDVTQPLGKKVPPGTNGTGQNTPNWDKRQPMMLGGRYAAMF